MRNTVWSVGPEQEGQNPLEELLLLLKTHTLADFVIPAGFEPATHGLEGRCSVQLSYGTSILLNFFIQLSLPAGRQATGPVF
jgi:hypothetical protein